MRQNIIQEIKFENLKKEGVVAPIGFIMASNYGPTGDYGLLRSGLNDIMRIQSHYPLEWRRFNILRATIKIAWDVPPVGIGPYIFGQSFMFHPDGVDIDPNNPASWQYWRNNIDIPVPVPNPLVGQTLSFDWAINLPPSFLVNKGDIFMWQIDENLATAVASLRVYEIIAQLL